MCTALCRAVRSCEMDANDRAAGWAHDTSCMGQHHAEKYVANGQNQNNKINQAQVKNTQGRPP